MKHIDIACENTDAVQAMYVDGVLGRADNFHLSDIAEIAEGKIVTLRILEVDLPEDNEWPESLEDLIEMQKRLTDVDNVSPEQQKRNDAMERGDHLRDRAKDEKVKR